jgi:recombinational DNA repair protein (RecF pathway)
MMTPEERSQLHRSLNVLAEAEAELLEARKPFDAAISAIADMRYGLLEQHGVSDDYDTCETCGELIFVGDEQFSFEDGPVLCGQHAPSRSELKKHLEECLATGNFDPEEMQFMKDGIANLEANVAAGGSWDDKVTYPR